MKRLLLISSLLTAGLFLSSCIDDFLTQYPYSTTSPETFFKTEDDFKQALSGCYSMINSSQMSYYYGLIYVLEGCSDEVVSNPASTGTLYDLLRGSYQTDNAQIRSFWVLFFRGISRCNTLIEQLKGENDLTTEQCTAYEAEARFLRGFFYLHLAQTFGGVPVYDAPAVGSTAARDNLERVYTQIIGDFKYAWDELEDAGIFKSSANRWTAAAYLGSVYNYLASCKRYDVGKELVGIQPLNDFGWVDEEAMSLAARDVLKEVVEKSPYELLNKNNYRKLYYEMSKEAQYKECLLMAEYAENTKHCMVSYYVLSPVGDAKTVGGSYQRMFPTMKLYRSYDNADVRRDYNITGAYNPNNRYGSDLSKIPSEMVDGYKYYVPAESSGIASGSSTALWCTGKFRVSDPKERSSISANQCVMNYPLMRMAEVRLQYAEALYFTGDEPGARKQFDPVRERVLAGDVSLKKLNEAYYRSDFIEELLEERGRELCYESKRKIDLIRFGRITKTIEELPSEGGPNNVVIGIDMLKDNWRNYKIWLPVPQLEIDLNPNLEQNAVYAD
ncbi:RagB/SusD family nutrient uptake outer membrane protein [Alistipes shahii]|uniref:RagB/SusD family nutrient uptake outer membrane protein n=1 Tax=Alistipes shahii TaxID=328814 RepID=UPI0011072291|nr:RagB/SusD family nutrient uptake outer membrane protein [Alistipes shahii]